MMHLSVFVLSFGLLFFGTVTSCNKVNGRETAAEQLDMRKVSYGNDTAQVMDVYLPANRDTGNTKVIMLIHGGSWMSGDKAEFEGAIPLLQTQLPDYAFFNINYRLANGGANKYPIPLHDVQSALSFIKDKATEYMINANKIVLVGASAGGHLALLQAYKNNSSGSIKAVVDLFGPTDLVDMYRNHPIPQEARYVLQNFLGTSLTSNANLYKTASPINYITAQTVPTKIFHGSGDFVVPTSQSTALKAKLQAHNVKVDMTIYQQEGHGWYGANLKDTYVKTIQFIKENVQ